METLSPAQIVKRFETLRSDRSNWEGYWEQVGNYCLPEKAFTITQPGSEGQKLNVYIYDTTALQSTGLLAAGLQGHLTSPAQKWFSLRFPNESLMTLEGVKEWLRDSEDKIYNALNSSNFNHQIHEAYLDLVVFGTCCLYEEESQEDIIRFDARPIREIFIVEDAMGKVVTVFRFYELTVEQAYGLYKDKAGAKCLEKYNKKEFDDKLPYLHVMGPREIREAGKADPINMPVFSKIIAFEDKALVSESGYPELPIFVARWEKNAFNRFGYSPAMKAYGDIKTANAIKEDLLKAAAKIVDPPIDCPHEGYLLPLDMTQGGINYRNTMDPNERIKQLDIQPNIPVGIEMLESERKNIKEAFFVDLFLLLERANMTATEVIQRNEEKMLLLGPVLGRLQNELLDRIIFRTFSILQRRGVINQIPDSLAQWFTEHPQDDNYEVRYEGRLAKMQRYSEAKATMDWLTLIQAIAGVKPEVLDLVNDEEIVRNGQEVYGVNPKFLNTPERIKQIRDQRAAQQESMMRMQMLSGAGKIAKDMGSASKSFEQPVAAGK